MAQKFMQVVLTPAVQAAEERFFGRSQSVPFAPERDVLGPEEVEFIQSRDSFYMATTNSEG